MKASRIKTIKDIDVCVRCGLEISYSEKFDAYYCERCNIWLEEKCIDPLCSVCTIRTIRPIKKDKLKIKKENKKPIEWETKKIK